MTPATTEEQDARIELEYEFGDPPHKVWRAISIAELRKTWLPEDALAEPEAIAVTPGEEVRYRMRDRAPPFLESTVTLRIDPNGSGGTRLRIIHELADLRPIRATSPAANTNDRPVMLAA